MTHTETPTITIFRVWKDTGTPIALFPGLNYDTGDANFGMCMSYGDKGHEEVDYDAVIRATRPALDWEYEDMLNDLLSLGVKMRILPKNTLR